MNKSIDISNYDYTKVELYEIKELDILEKDMFLLNFNDNKYLKVNTFTKNLIEKFNGRNKISDIISLLTNDGINVSEEELIIFIDDFLIKNSIVEGKEKKKEFKLSFTFHIPLVEGKKLNFIYDKIKWLFSKKIVILLTIFCMCSQLMVLLEGSVNTYLEYKNSGGNALSVIVLFLIGTILHEMGHATAARYYKANVGKIGVGIYLFMPIAYTDLSNIWMLKKKERIVINCGGFYFSIIYSSILWIIGSLTSNSNLIIVNIIIMITMIMNLNPLLRMDGYWILSDYLGIVNVNKRMLELLIYIFKKIFMLNAKSPLNNTKEEKKIYYIYFICYLICNIAFLIIGIGSVIKLFI